MRFRVKHLLALMLFAALWAPLSKWLLALEARDHPWKPQETIDVVAFYLGTTSLLAIPWTAIVMRKRVLAGRTAQSKDKDKVDAP